MSKELTVAKAVILNNAGMVELEKAVTNLYVKRLVTKDEIKELINNLKALVNALPDLDETYLH